MSKVTTPVRACRIPARLRRCLASMGTATLAVGVLSAVPAIDAVLGSGLFSDAGAYAQNDEQRAPPPTRSSQTLSRQVYSRIEEVMELREEESYDEAIEVLDELREMYDRDRLNDRETYVMFQFYAAIAQSRENYEQAIEYYREMLELENLTLEQIEQTLFYVGQLEFVLENFQAAIDAFLRYLDIAAMPDDGVYLRIGTGYYQLEQYQEAIPYIIQNIEMLRAKNERIPQNTFGLLRAMYLTLEDYENAGEVTREMVALFNDADDWTMLAGINGQLENFTQQAHLYYVAYHGDYLDSENQLMNLAFQLFNNDNPFGAGEVIAKGMEDGIIEEDADNLSFLSQAWQIAREDERAAPPLARAAEMTDEGEMYYRLGRIYMTMANFEDAVDALNNALDADGEEVDRPDQVNLLLANALMQLNRHDEALAAARAARSDERSRDTANNWVSVLESDKRRYETNQRRRRELAEYFRN